MKYTIELTDNQKKQMDLLCEIAHRYIGFNRKLEMVETINVEDTNEYQIGYEVGFEDGAKAQNEVQYSKGLEDGYKGYRYIKQWFASTCFFDTEDILFPEYKRRQADTCCLEDIITDVGITEVLKRVRAYEEKKKGEKEIKVGDILHEIDTNSNHIIVGIYKGHYETIVFNGTDFDSAQINRDYTLKTDYEKLDKNVFNEVSQLLDKLKGEEDEKN